MRQHAALRAISAGVLICLSSGVPARGIAEELSVNDSPGRPGEWGLRPSIKYPTAVNPPAFVWRPNARALTYEIQCSQTEDFTGRGYKASGIKYNCHCPPKTLKAGRWYWRFRYRDIKGRPSRWSRSRSFVIGEDAVELPMPARKELLARIPKRHPRLFIRPGQLPALRKLAKGKLKDAHAEMIAECDKLLSRPPSTKEPPLYPPRTVSHSEEWREIWWGNRRKVIRTLGGASKLAFAWLITGKEEYGQLARRLLIAAAEWDPKGATGYRYNDEAGMPYNYFFSRTYTFVNGLLSEEEKAKCREVMTIRGREMYEHLHHRRRHIWKPYGSHSNRAWHFLGEIGVAFLDEIPEASDWVWYAMNIFYCVYPAWCDSEGGWHEGIGYWRSYLDRFTWWADIMKAAMDVNAYRKPYFSQIGYYPMYFQPPGTVGGGFGDMGAWQKSGQNVSLMTGLAAQGGNAHWRWYVDAHGGPRQTGRVAALPYVRFARGILPDVQAEPPIDLPSSRCFRGTGQAVLNTTLTDAKKNVEIVFKSSPLGSQSHGYESQNAFVLYAFGKRLLIRSGQRDIHGSDHHRNWMWQTKSVNSITVDGRGQIPHSPACVGEILAFHTSDVMDFVSGEAARAYESRLERFTRSILFVKPDLIVIFDRLEAHEGVTYQWLLHSPTEMKLSGQEDIRVLNGRAACRVSILTPRSLELSLTHKFDPPPRERVKLTEWHLTGGTKERKKKVEFVTVIRPYKSERGCKLSETLHEVSGGYALDAELTKGRATILLRNSDSGKTAFADFTADADVAAVRYDSGGRALERLLVEGRRASSQ